MARQRPYDHALELRAFAKKARQIRYRGTERYLEELDELAGEMDRRADAAARSDDQVLEGVFMTGAGRSAGGTPFQAERKARAVRAAM